MASDVAIDNLKGKRFGRLVVLSEAGRTQAQRVLWQCRCDCGREDVFATTTNLKSSNPKVCKRSCGCLQREIVSQICRKRNTTHNRSKTKIFAVWAAMIQRCENPNRPDYERYGGRGVQVCPQWRESFERFYLDMGEPESAGLTIDRIDNDGDYEPGNCRWATRKQQARNNSRNRFITYQSQTACIQEWSEITGLKAKTLAWRLRMGWSVERALTEIPATQNRQ